MHHKVWCFYISTTSTTTPHSVVWSSSHLEEDNSWSNLYIILNMMYVCRRGTYVCRGTFVSGGYVCLSGGTFVQCVISFADLTLDNLWSSSTSGGGSSSLNDGLSSPVILLPPNHGEIPLIILSSSSYPPPVILLPIHVDTSNYIY